MKKSLKKRALIMFIFGFILAAISFVFILKEYQAIRFGKSVTATVIGTKTSEVLNRTIVRLEYKDGNTTKIIEPPYLFNVYSIGRSVSLRLYQNSVTIPALNNGFWLSLIGSFIIGIFLFLKGLVWLFRHKEEYANDVVYLKRFGKRVHARYDRTEESAQRKDGSYGKIFVLKQIDSERVFVSDPIFNQESIMWLEEHLFDVYIHKKKSKKYYIDFEKHFGQE
jgi:hypothetical protein